MKLADIRKADREGIKRAIKDVIQNQHKMTLGTMHATTRTLLDRGKTLGMSVEELNRLARGET